MATNGLNEPVNADAIVARSTAVATLPTIDPTRRSLTKATPRPRPRTVTAQKNVVPAGELVSLSPASRYRGPSRKAATGTHTVHTTRIHDAQLRCTGPRP